MLPSPIDIGNYIFILRTSSKPVHFSRPIEEYGALFSYQHRRLYLIPESLVKLNFVLLVVDGDGLHVRPLDNDDHQLV